MRGIKVGAACRFQKSPGLRWWPAKVTMVYHREGTVEVVLDNAGVYLVPVTPRAVEVWTEAAKKLSPSWDASQMWDALDAAPIGARCQVNSGSQKGTWVKLDRDSHHGEKVSDPDLWANIDTGQTLHGSWLIEEDTVLLPAGR
jgi:hypothetical protein